MKNLLSSLILLHLFHAYTEAAPNAFDDPFPPEEKTEDQNLQFVDDLDAKREAQNHQYIFTVRPFGDGEVRHHFESWKSDSICLDDIIKALSDILDRLLGKGCDKWRSFRNFLKTMKRSLHIPQTLKRWAKALRDLIDKAKEVGGEDCEIVSNAVFNTVQQDEYVYYDDYDYYK